MAVRAVIFDADGTIIDSRAFVLGGFRHALHLHGHRIPDHEELHDAVRGLPLEECYRRLAPNGDIHALCSAHREFQSTRQDLIEPYDGLHSLLTSLRKRGLKIAVCSSRGKTLKPSLRHLDVDHYFDVIIDGEDVVNCKPHPEPIFKTLTLLGVLPHEAVMVGDTPADICAGKAASLRRTVGITHGFSSHETLRASGADKIFRRLKDVQRYLSREL